MKSKFFWINLTFLAGITVSDALAMKSDAQASAETSAAAVDVLSDHPYTYFLENKLPYVEVTLSDGSILQIDQHNLENFLDTGNFTLPSGKQILQTNFRKIGWPFYQTDFKKTLSWNLHLVLRNLYCVKKMITERNSAKTPSPEQEAGIKTVMHFIDQQYKNLQQCLNAPSCPCASAVIVIFMYVYERTGNLSSEEASQKAAMFYNSLTQKIPNPESVELFTRRPWKEIMDLLYEDDFARTIKYNFTLLEKTKKSFDETLVSLEHISTEIDALETGRAIKLRTKTLSEKENKTIEHDIANLWEQEEAIKQQQNGNLDLLNQQATILGHYIRDKSFPTIFFTPIALHIAEIFIDINRFETIDDAYGWIALAQKHFVPHTLFPKENALYWFLCAQREIMDGHRANACEIFKKIDAKFLSPKHRAQRDLTLAESGLLCLPAAFTLEHYRNLISIQQHLNRVSATALDTDGQSLLSSAETTALQEHHRRTVLLFDFLRTVQQK